MFESQLIRYMTFVLSAYMVLNAIHQLISINGFKYSAWIVTTVEDTTLANTLLGISIAIGIAIAGSLLKRSRRLLLGSLIAATAYQLALGILNAGGSCLLGSVWITSFLMGIMSAALWSYYKVQRDALGDKFRYIKVQKDSWER